MCVLKSSHRLDGNSLLTCNSTLAVQILFHHREMCVLMLRITHCPDGIFTCFALMLAGRRCLHQRHGELLMVHHHWQLGLRSACSRSKVPIAPMGKCLAFFESTRQSFGFYLVLAPLPAKCPHGVKRMTFQPCTVVTSQWHRIPYCPRRGPMLLSVEARSAPGQQPSRVSMAQSQLARHRHHTLLEEHRCRRLRPRPHRHPLRRATQRATRQASSSESSSASSRG